jgi:hypothetical protein
MTYEHPTYPPTGWQSGDGTPAKPIGEVIGDRWEVQELIAVTWNDDIAARFPQRRPHLLPMPTRRRRPLRPMPRLALQPLRSADKRLGTPRLPRQSRLTQRNIIGIEQELN